MCAFSQSSSLRFTRVHCKPVNAGRCISREHVVARAVNVERESEAARRTKSAVTYTHYGTNSFTLEFRGGGKVLVDPWLVGTLSFGEQTWLLESSKYLPSSVESVLEGVDAILLSQSLDDHTHIPTLKVLPKNIPIVAQPDAAEVACGLGFTDVRSLDHGEQAGVADGQVSVKALPGALVGPPWSKRQNSFLIEGRKDDASSVTVYAEPHASHDVNALKSIAPVDVAIFPAASSYVAGYPVVEGIENGEELIRAIQPSVVVPLDNADGSYEGVVAGAITSVGSNRLDAVKKWVADMGINGVAVEAPSAPGEPLAISL